MNANTVAMIERAMRLGLSMDDVLAIRRASMTLQRWAELECGNGDSYKSWSIERDEDSGIPYMVTHWNDRNEANRTRIADREAGAIRRINAIVRKVRGLRWYHQGDPRGAAVYLYRLRDLKKRGPDARIGSCYSSIGVAIYK